MTAELLTGPTPLFAAHPLEAWRPTVAAMQGVDLLADAAAVDLRVPPVDAALSAAADALGSPLPRVVGTWSDLGGGARAFCLGPDEWLVTDSTRGDATAWERALIDALRPHGGAAVDVTAQRTGLRLGGGAARELLAFGCSLDLRPAAFGPGSCAQTVVWGAPVLMAADDDGVDLLVRSSFAGHLAARLVDAAQELRPDPAPPPHP